jgi:hypothetical protein
MSSNAANKSPIFPVSPNNSIATLAAATTGRSVTGVAGLTLLCAAAADGTRIDAIRCYSCGAVGVASSANVVRIWVYKGSGNAALIDEIAVAAATPSASAVGALAENIYARLALKSGESLYCSMHTYAGAQDAMNVVALGGDY